MELHLVCRGAPLAELVVSVFPFPLSVVSHCVGFSSSDSLLSANPCFLYNRAITRWWFKDHLPFGPSRVSVPSRGPQAWAYLAQELLPGRGGASEGTGQGWTGDQALTGRELDVCSGQ